MEISNRMRVKLLLFEVFLYYIKKKEKKGKSIQWGIDVE
jgi:hypothetical protein